MPRMVGGAYLLMRRGGSKAVSFAKQVVWRRVFSYSYRGTQPYLPTAPSFKNSTRY